MKMMEALFIFLLAISTVQTFRYTLQINPQMSENDNKTRCVMYINYVVNMQSGQLAIKLLAAFCCCE